MADFNGSFEPAWEPEQWFVTFHRESARWWVNLLAGGRFKHVSAFGYVAGAGAWVFFDVLASRMRIRVAANDLANVLLAEQSASGTVIRMPKNGVGDGEVRLKAGFWCVPAVAHLVGMRASALRPDELYRQCLANGGEIIGGQDS